MSISTTIWVIFLLINLTKNNNNQVNVFWESSFEKENLNFLFFYFILTYFILFYFFFTKGFWKPSFWGSNFKRAISKIHFLREKFWKGLFFKRKISKMYFLRKHNLAYLTLHTLQIRLKRQYNALNKEVEPIQPVEMNMWEVILIAYLLVKFQYAGQQLYF